MKVPLIPLLAALTLPCLSSALDLTEIAENDPDALKQAVEAEGGSVEGEPYLVTDSGPDGTPTKLLMFPTPNCLVSLAVTPTANDWSMRGAIRIDEAPYAKSGGPIFGILFGRNDCVMALTADRWSKALSPALMSGSAILVEDNQLKESGALEGGDWHEITMIISGDEWQLKIDETFSQTGFVEGDTRGGLHRKGTLFMRVGSFGGAATIPKLDVGN